VFLGRATRTKATGYLQRYELGGRVPHLKPGAYSFVAYVPMGHARDRGILVSSVPTKKPFQVSAESTPLAAQQNDSNTGWWIAALAAVAISVAGGLRIRGRRSRRPALSSRRGRPSRRLA
jgi:hypothetical protein